MAIYLFLDDHPGSLELSRYFERLTPVDVTPWMQDIGFMWCGRIDEELTYFADSTRVTPYPNLLSRKLWLEDLLKHYKKLDQLRSSPDYDLRIKSLRDELAEIEDRKEALLKPAREFSAKNLSDENYYNADWRKSNRENREELVRIYRELKSTPEYLALERREEELVSSGRDLLEADGYPQTEAEAERMRASDEGFVAVHDRVTPPTLKQKIDSIQTALDSLETLSGQKRFLSDLIRTCVTRYDQVGIAVANSMAPMPTGVVEVEDFLRSMPLPLPKRRLFIIQARGKTA